MRARLAALLLLALHAETARAGAMEVNPVLVSLSRDEKSAVVSIRNRSAEPARYQVSIVAWDQTPDGEMKLAPTQDVVAFPPVLSLAPDQAKIVRVGAKVPFGKVERSYRLFVEELPPPPRPEEASRVQVLSRVGIPVFLAPDRAVEKAQIGELRLRAGKLEFSLENLGNVRVRPSFVKVALDDAGGKPLDLRALDAWYVLPASRRDYAVEISAEACRAVRRVSVEAALPAETLRASLETPQGACAQ